MQIHPSSLVAPEARIGSGVRVGPYAVVGPEVQVGEETVIEAFAVLEGRTVVGPACRIGTGAVLGSAPQDLHYDGEPTELVLGNGVAVGPYVTISRGTPGGCWTTRVGDGCLLEYGAHVGHDCQLGSGVHVAAMAGLAGHVTVEDGAAIGPMAGLHQFVRVGRLARIEGLSRVVKDVPPFVRVGGSPIQLLGLNEEAFQADRLKGPEGEAVRRAVRLLYSAGLSTDEAADRMERELGAFEAVRHLATFLRESRRGVMR